MTRPRISASKIGTYSTCARLYYLDYIERRDRSDNPAAIMGSALHKAIELYYTDGSNPRDVYQHEMHARVSAAFERGSMRFEYALRPAYKDGYDILDRFEWSRFTPVALEQHFILPFPDAANAFVDIEGYIDMISGKGEALDVIDHKSAKKQPAAEELAHNTQMLIYAWAFKQMHGHYPGAVYWNHLRTGELIRADVLTDIDRKLDELAEQIRKILGTTEYNKREKDGFCIKVCRYHNECWT